MNHRRKRDVRKVNLKDTFFECLHKSYNRNRFTRKILWWDLEEKHKNNSLYVDNFVINVRSYCGFFFATLKRNSMELIKILKFRFFCFVKRKCYVIYLPLTTSNFLYLLNIWNLNILVLWLNIFLYICRRNWFL